MEQLDLLEILMEEEELELGLIMTNLEILEL